MKITLDSITRSLHTSNRILLAMPDSATEGTVEIDDPRSHSQEPHPGFLGSIDLVPRQRYSKTFAGLLVQLVPNSSPPCTIKRWEYLQFRSFNTSALTLHSLNDSLTSTESVLTSGFASPAPSKTYL
jgi:hypothetical protein